jgi:pimeloyl-ACP methyl ester carboxylesterase
VVLGAGAYLIDRWYETPVVVVEPPRRSTDATGEVEARPTHVERWRIGADWRTAGLVAGVLLLFTGLGGGRLVMPLLKRSGEDDPRQDEGTDSARGGTAQEIRRPDGSVLRAMTFGPEGAPVIVWTHGWGVNSAEWHYAKTHLADRYRLIVWDLPGLGRSKGPDDRDWSLERMAGDLEAVLGLAGDRPAVLVGHSIGGMITLTFCRLFPEALGSRVAGLVLVHTTPTNPVKTTGMAPFYAAIQKPVLERLCYLMIGLAPLVWAMNWLAYLNGSQHRSTEKSGFSGRESRQQLDFAARFLPRAWPGVVARGMLAMFRYDATDVLGRIGVPTLVVVGDEDNTTRPEAGARIRDAIPAARLVALSPARHMGHLEHHAPFAEAVARFVSEGLVAATAGASGPGTH